tara:strand:+ start:2122 stop:2580 length:459 start_codon:yes stop_codon:yes gene_type:complete
MADFLDSTIDIKSSIGDIIQIESGGFLDEYGTQKWVEVPQIKNTHCVPRALAMVAGEDYRYREEVKVQNEFGERPIRIPHLIQGEECFILVLIKKMIDLERRQHIVNEWMDALESYDLDFKLLILHPGFSEENLTQWEGLWPIQHVNIPYGV